MAKQENSTKTTVRRIKAKDDAPRTGKTKPAATSAKAEPRSRTTAATKATSTRTGTSRPSAATSHQLGYFKGAWHELSQVRWPTRSATWSMTVAVLVFSLIFALLIIVLDIGFNWLFQQILK